jgi:Tfp pilus assembly protein PilF
MDCNMMLGALNVLVAFLGVAFAVFAYVEWRSLQATRSEFEEFREEVRGRSRKTQKALQRVIASYGVQDIDQKITLLSDAVEIDPDVFNGFNALGYAYLEKGEVSSAIDAFRESLDRFPKDKEAYFDLARLYVREENIAVATKYLRRAVKFDPSARNDILGDDALAPVKRYFD